MSSNLDLVRSIYADWDRGEHKRTDWADPEIEYVSLEGPEPGAWKGLAGMAEGWGNFVRVWEDFHTQVERFQPLDDERILVLVARNARAKASGLRVQADAADLWHLRAGRVKRLVFYWDRDRAFADLGLNPAGS